MIHGKSAMKNVFPELAGTTAYAGRMQVSTHHDMKASEIVNKRKHDKVTDGPTPVPRKRKKKTKALPSPTKIVVHGGITVNGNVTIVHKTVAAKSVPGTQRRPFVPASDPHEDALQFEETPFYYGYGRKTSDGTVLGTPPDGRRLPYPKRRLAHQHA